MNKKIIEDIIKNRKEVTLVLNNGFHHKGIVFELSSLNFSGDAIITMRDSTKGQYVRFKLSSISRIIGGKE